MLLRDLYYELPPERIAQVPAEPRDASRLLVLDRRTGSVEHARFCDIGRWLRRPDCLVLNDTRVIPARFFARRASGGRVEGLFLHAAESGAAGPAWRVLLKPAARLRVGEELELGAGRPRLAIVARHARGEWSVRASPPCDPLALLDRIGFTPLPPYIERDLAAALDVHAADGPARPDAQRYQTVYAARPGAVAAPTAGMHFTPELLARLAGAGVRRADLTLHVGPGTFLPIEAADLRDHRMHAEWFELPESAAELIRAARAAGGRIVSVGTTTARVLESCADPGGRVAPRCGWTDIFIHPPHEFRAVDALITNFHLPGSTLLAMVMAFAGIEPIRAAYAEAIALNYRFYSYGDAMLLL